MLIALSVLTPSLPAMIQVHWFEKFNWFVSSENFLVIGGKDAQQNELVVSKYLQKTDVYLHADAHGASSVVIKNLSGGEIPPITLAQAGSFCVNHSAAWKNKVMQGAYWVYANQVSKTAPTGEYLSTGSFMIRGKKNFLHQEPLVMCFGLFFRVDDTCVAKHQGERWIRVATEDIAEERKLKGVAAALQAAEDDREDTAGEEPGGQADFDVTSLLMKQTMQESTEGSVNQVASQFEEEEEESEEEGDGDEEKEEQEEHQEKQGQKEEEEHVEKQEQEQEQEQEEKDESAGKGKR